MLEGEETEMVFIDHPHSEISVNGEKCETDTEFRAHYGVQIIRSAYKTDPRSVVGLNFTCMHQKETVRSQGFYLTCTTYCAFSKGFSQTNFRLCMIDQGAPSENFILSISEPRRRRTAE